MNLYEFPPIKALVGAVYWLVTELGDLLEPLAGSSSAALGVIALTVLVRIALIPVGWSQVKANASRQRLAPQLRALHSRYGKNPELLRRKTAELYRAEKASPFAGCLPVLAQAPILMAVYGVFIQPTISGQQNTLLTEDLFGIPLGASFTGLLAEGSIDGTACAVFLTLVAVIALIAQGSRRLLKPVETAPPPATPTQRSANKQPGSPAIPELPQGFVTSLGFLPFLTAVFAAFVPLAAALYLATTTAWTLAERLVLTRVSERGAARGAMNDA